VKTADAGSSFINEFNILRLAVRCDLKHSVFIYPECNFYGLPVGTLRIDHNPTDSSYLSISVDN
jgi:hypothetical protein